jgi:hypothetical protein
MQPEVGPFPQGIPQHQANLLGCNLLRHGLPHQDGRDPFSVVVRELKTQHRWLRARWQAYCHDTHGFLPRRKMRGLHVAFEN